MFYVRVGPGMVLEVDEMGFEVLVMRRMRGWDLVFEETNEDSASAFFWRLKGRQELFAARSREEWRKGGTQARLGLRGGFARCREHPSVRPWVL